MTETRKQPSQQYSTPALPEFSHVEKVSPTDQPAPEARPSTSPFAL